jgi:transcriptional regulator with PAS, ATPase and Fis domain
LDPDEPFGMEGALSDIGLLGESSGMRAVARIVAEVADTDAIILIRGESGVGKDLVARTIHAVSARREQPFVKVNCAAIPVELLESELFGHERGAFTGAFRRSSGQFELAHRGTIYLDEVAELPLPMQAKLLHVLQDLRFTPLGGRGSLVVDTRVIAATNQNLEDAIVRGHFRADLYYRLNVVEIQVPPLRERPEEIPTLAAVFLARFNARYGRARQISPALMTRLTGYPWPGNVRELENVIRRLVVLDREPALDIWTDAARGPSAPHADGLREIARRGAREAERQALQDVLEAVRWNRAEAARILKVSYKSLLNKVSEYRLAPSNRLSSARAD